MHKIVLLRHGESTWNKENRFTGWTDVDLSEKGIEEAREAGKTLKKEKFAFDLVYNPFLKRSIRTTWIVLDEMDLMWIKNINAWQLNERHYGALQGLNKAEMAKKYGEQQVLIWRRSYSTRPPALKKEDKQNPKFDPKYKNISYHPLAESLEDTVNRVIPYWKKEIAPQIKKGKKILISAHGNSLRAIVMYLNKLSTEEVLQLNIPTGIPLVYELDKDLKPIKHYYIGDKKRIEEAISRVKNQGKAKK